MSRSVSRFTALAVAVLVPLAAGCSDGDRSSTGSGSSTTTASTGAATPTPSSTPATTSTEKPRSTVVGTVAPSYADADRAFHRGRYEEAASMFEAYSESNPDNAWGHYMLGLSAWKTGDHTRALEAFDAALRIEPTHRKSLLNSARVLLETSRPQDALDRVEQALAIEPLSGEALRLEGRAHHELGQIPQAIDAYQRALALDDHDVWAMNNLGYLYIQQGRCDAALPPLARAVEIRSNVPVFQNNFATALERSGYFVAARQAYEAALQADSTYSKASVGLDRVNAHGTVSDTSTVDVAALSKEFQDQVEQWRARPSVATDSAKATPAVDTSGMVRDSVPQ
jgi:predicted Zn-dependent protease